MYDASQGFFDIQLLEAPKDESYWLLPLALFLFLVSFYLFRFFKRKLSSYRREGFLKRQKKELLKLRDNLGNENLKESFSSMSRKLRSSVDHTFNLQTLNKTTSEIKKLNLEDSVLTAHTSSFLELIETANTVCFSKTSQAKGAEPLVYFDRALDLLDVLIAQVEQEVK